MHVFGEEGEILFLFFSLEDELFVFFARRNHSRQTHQVLYVFVLIEVKVCFDVTSIDHQGYLGVIGLIPFSEKPLPISKFMIGV